MKLNRNNLFIGISSLALVAVLIIQVSWIIQTAQIKEALFNEKANMVLSKTAEALSADKATCKQMEDFVGQKEMKTTDSLFNNYMDLYNFHIDYSFEVKKPLANNESPKQLPTTVYKQRLEEAASKSGLEINLFLPEKRQFILAEMGPLFISTVVLILAVLFMFWRTIRSLMKEKKIADHTSDFLNNMTHEFKTPLTNIALAGKMIGKETVIKDEQKIRHYSGIILQENEKLRQQVEQVLSMTALERGEIPVQKSTIDFHELIHEAVRCIQIQIEHQQGSLRLALDAAHHQIYGDKTHLINALCNLIDNAIKYSASKPFIKISTSNNNKQLLISISDQGMGIKKEYQHLVFDKFFRIPTGNVHDVKGFGLGLAYVKKIIELHQGSIELQSEPGQGSTFTISLAHE